MPQTYLAGAGQFRSVRMPNCLPNSGRSISRRSRVSRPQRPRQAEDHRRHRGARGDCQDTHTHLGLPARAPPRSPARPLAPFQAA